MNLHSRKRDAGRAEKRAHAAAKRQRPLSSADAPDLHRAALRIAPMRSALWNAYGGALLNRRRFPAAMLAGSNALAIDPACADALGNIAALLRDMEYPSQAELALRRALRAAPEHPGLHNALVHVLQGSGRGEEARAACRRALALAPAFADAWCNAGLGEQQAGRRGNASSLFIRAVRIDAEHALARFNGALLALEEGRIAAGWRDYRHRFAAGQARPRRRFAIPEWNGEALKGGKLLIWREQGVGDEILFSSCYADAIKAVGAGADQPSSAVVVECDPRLAGLFARSFPQATVRAARRVDAGGDHELVERTDCAQHISAGSLPALLRARLGDFPQRVRWLFADDNLIAVWRREVEALGRQLRVGFAWSSGLATLNRRGAYAPLALWGPVLTTPGVSFVNLQRGAVTEELAAAERAFGIRVVAAPRLDLKDDFENLAALISCLDLVIAPAVSVAELSAALGTPTWRFGARDWTQLGSAARPWSPSMRCFQPSTGEGLQSALVGIGRALKTVVGKN